MNRIDVTLTINLPEALVERAESAGLPTAQQIERWLIDELERQQKLDRFFAKLGRLADPQNRPTPEEIDAEIAAYRLEKNH